MCLFAPHFSRNNDILVDKEEDAVPFRPVIPSSKRKLLVIALSFSYRDNIQVIKGRQDDDLPRVVEIGSNDNDDISITSQRTLFDWSGFGGEELPSFDSCLSITREGQKTDTIDTSRKELGGKQQMKLLEERSHKEKIEQTAVKIAAARARFEESMNKLSYELNMAKNV